MLTARLTCASMFLIILGCVSAPASSPTDSDAAPESTFLHPIISEEQAIQIGGYLMDSESAEARLMTLAEYLRRFTSDRIDDALFPVWVVLLEGVWERSNSVRATPIVYNYAVEVLDARTGSSSNTGRPYNGLWLSEPIDLDSATLLDPANYARYPVQVSMADARGIVEFQVSEPAYLPKGYALSTVSLEVVSPIQELYDTQRLTQAVSQTYSGVNGDAFQLTQTGRGFTTSHMPDAQTIEIGHSSGWMRQAPGGPNWLTWRALHTSEATNSRSSITYLIYSESGALGLDEMRRIAASLPPGELRPMPTPAPTVPTLPE